MSILCVILSYFFSIFAKKIFVMKKKFYLGSLALIAMMGFSSCCGGEEKKCDSVSFDKVIETRRSIRSYDASKTISEAQLRELFVSVQEAPSWANQQPSKYYVATSKEKVEAVQNLVGPNKEKIQGAPVLIVSTYERGKSGFFQGEQTNEIGDGWGAYDNGLSNAYLILKARAMGFDSLIMGLRDASQLHSLFGIPENETVMAVIALGFRAEEPKSPTHRSLNEVVKFF